MTTTAFSAFYRAAAPVSSVRRPVASIVAASGPIATPAPGVPQQPSPPNRVVSFLGDAMATWATGGRLRLAD